MTEIAEKNKVRKYRQQGFLHFWHTSCCTYSRAAKLGEEVGWVVCGGRGKALNNYNNYLISLVDDLRTRDLGFP